MPKRPDRHVGSLKKDEVERLDELKRKALATRKNDRPDVDSTMELMYLRMVGRVKNRGPSQAELKQLKGSWKSGQPNEQDNGQGGEAGHVKIITPPRPLKIL